MQWCSQKTSICVNANVSVTFDMGRKSIDVVKNPVLTTPTHPLWLNWLTLCLPGDTQVQNQCKLKMM